MSESKGPSMFRVGSHLPRLAFSDFDIWIINALTLYFFYGAESFIAGTRFIGYFENRGLRLL